MKHLIVKISLVCLLVVACNFQDPQPIVTDENSIEPTVVDQVTQTHPSLNTNNEPVTNNNEPVINNNEPAQTPPVNQEHSQIQSQNQQPKQEGVLLSNENMNGLEGEAIPVNQEQINKMTNEEQPQSNEEALAKSKEQAEKAKQMAEEARRQAENDRKSRDQQEDEELRNIQFDQTLSKTERKKQEERLLFRKASRNVEQGTRFTEYLFEQGLGASEFFIKIPAAQQVAINLYTYVAQDNTYVRTKNIEEEQPVKIYIYENNQRIVYEGEFYYQSYIIFQGQADAMYLIKVVNNGRTKLISMNCKKLVEETHLGDTLQKNEAQHVERTQNLAIDIHKWHQDFRKIRMLDFQDLKAIEGYIEKYYSWEVIESFVAIIICAFQVKMIQNMLKGGSIV